MKNIVILLFLLISIKHIKSQIVISPSDTTFSVNVNGVTGGVLNGGPLGRSSGVIYTFTKTTGTFADCSYWGIDLSGTGDSKSNMNNLVAPPTIICSYTSGVPNNYFSYSSGLSSATLNLTGSSIVNCKNSSWNYEDKTINTRATITTSTGTFENDGNLYLLDISGLTTFTITVKYEGQAPPNAQYINSHVAGTWVPLVTLFDDLHTDQNRSVCTSFDSRIYSYTPVGGDSDPDQKLCLRETPSTVTLTGYSNGNIIKWQMDDNIAFTTPSDIANTSTTLTGAEMETSFGGPLTSTQYVRAVIDNDKCTERYSLISTIKVNDPLDITTNDVTGTCYIKANSGWNHIYDANENIIASINNNNNVTDLGNTTVTVYQHGGSSFTIPATGSCTQQQAVMNRSFVINSANSFSNAVAVRLYFKDSELADLIDNSLTSQSTGGSLNWTTHDPNGCEDNDDVLNIGDVRVTQISNSTSEDGVFDPGNGTFTYHNPYDRSLTGDTHFGADWVEISVTGFSEFWLHGSEHGAPLPVEYLYLKANAIDNKYIKIDWATAQEINNDGFELEKSKDGITFRKVAWINGSGNSNTTNFYTFNDHDVSSGTYYYRLKQIDFDDNFEYSDIVFATINLKFDFNIGNIHPNPSDNNSKIDITISKETKVNIEIYNTVGQIVSNKEINLKTGINTLNFDTRLYSSGVYSVIFIINDKNFKRKLFAK